MSSQRLPIRLHQIACALNIQLNELDVGDMPLSHIFDFLHHEIVACRNTERLQLENFFEDLQLELDDIEEAVLGPRDEEHFQ